MENVTETNPLNLSAHLRHVANPQICSEEQLLFLLCTQFVKGIVDPDEQDLILLATWVCLEMYTSKLASPVDLGIHVFRQTHMMS